jgi:hypothetical protein
LQVVVQSIEEIVPTPGKEAVHTILLPPAGERRYRSLFPFPYLNPLPPPNLYQSHQQDARAVAHHTDFKFKRVLGSKLVKKYIGEVS